MLDKSEAGNLAASLFQLKYLCFFNKGGDSTLCGVVLTADEYTG